MAWKVDEVDGRSPGRTGSTGKLAEGLLAAWKVDGNWRKVLRSHGMQTEVDRRSAGFMES